MKNLSDKSAKYEEAAWMIMRLLRILGAEQARKNPQFNWGSIKTYSTKKDLLC